MGIYSYHRLAILDNQNNTVIKGSALEEILQNLFNDYDEADRALTLDGSCNDEAKWYDASNNLKNFSKKYPEHTFILGVSLCAPESEDEEGEYFEAFRNGSVTSIREPSFMKAATEFSYYKNLDELKEIMNIFPDVDQENITHFLFFIPIDEEVHAKEIFKRLASTSLKDDLHLSIRSGVGKPNFVIHLQLANDRTDEFWEIVEYTLVEAA